MSRKYFLGRLRWIEGKPEGVILQEGIGPILYQDGDGAVYALNELEPIPRSMTKYAILYDHNIAKCKKDCAKLKPTLSPAQRDQLYNAFVDSYIAYHPEATRSLPRDRAYRNQRADFIQLSNLINQRGPEWVLNVWSEVLDRYFHPDRFKGIRTLADMCKRIDVVLDWEPQPNGRGKVFVAEAKGKR